MKHLLLPLLLCSSLISCTQTETHTERIDPNLGDPVKIDPTKPPSGMHLVQILLENQSLPVKGTGCQSGLSEDKRRLQHALAVTLGEGIDNPRHQSVLSAKCETDRYELPSGKKIDAWHCSLGVVEKNEKGEDIASSHIDFGVTKDTWEFVPVPKALVCM